MGPDNKHASVRLLFGGDFAPRGQYEPLIAARGGDVFGATQELIRHADFTIVNLETPICRDGLGIAKAGPVIRAEAETLRALTEAGIDAVCLANNHIFDYGKDGLSQTLDALRARGLRHVGAGLDRESAETPIRLEIRGWRLSLFSFAEREFNVSDDGVSGAAMLDPIRIAPLLLQERAKADAVIVCFHGGNEYFPYPRPGLRKLCQFLIDIGADAVIGHHPHVPGAYELYRARPIVYSLGNLTFDTRLPPPEWDEGYFANLDFAFGDSGLTNVKLELIPYHQAIVRGGLQPMQGQERVDFLARIERMREQLEIWPDEWLDAWKNFVERRRMQTFSDISFPVGFRGFGKLVAWRFLRNVIDPPSRQLHRLNLLRCDSHRELLVSGCEVFVHEEFGSQPRLRTETKSG